MGQTNIMSNARVFDDEILDSFRDGINVLVDPKQVALDPYEDFYFGNGQDGIVRFSKNGFETIGYEPNYTSILRQSFETQEEVIKKYGAEAVFPELRKLRNILEDLL